ncbi:MAG: hypothetical protein IJ631_00825, partial [Schwartzia sp.]|nr:hypothetical protein [Schwartzia sp. (in: firmicutes)]
MIIKQDKMKDCVIGLTMATMNDLLGEMEQYAREHDVPILTAAARPVFLRVVRETAPRRILELGTAIGY